LGFAASAFAALGFVTLGFLALGAAVGSVTADSGSS